MSNEVIRQVDSLLLIRMAIHENRLTDAVDLINREIATMSATLLKTKEGEGCEGLTEV